MVVIKTKDFVLRQYRKSDVDSLVNHINHKEIARNTLTVPYPYNQKDGIFWINKCLKEYGQKKKEQLCLAIEIDKEIVGSIDITINNEHKGSLGYWIGEKYWGKGLMTRIVRNFVNYCFKEFKLKRIQAGIFPWNKGSRRVLEKNGFKFEGRLRKSEYKDGKCIDELMFAKIR
jgi:[ribosomal protein S5]-alanine N-acetyltransferase